MAQAKILPVKPARPEVQLTLSADEADTLAAIFYRIGGEPARSPRKHINAMQDALREVGHQAHDVPHLTNLVEKTLWLANYPEDSK